MSEEYRKTDQFVDPASLGLKPAEPLDLSKCHNAYDLVKAMGKTSFGGRTVGRAHDILYNMIEDKDCGVVLTLSGAMTVAKMGLIICDLIDKGFVQMIVSTGALMTHGFIESTGKAHYQCDPQVDDTEYFKYGFNRVYDTIELEENLDDAELIVRSVLEKWDSRQTLCSQIICRELGRYLTENTPGRGILKSAFQKNVPVFIPAFTDSELGIDVAIFKIRQKKLGKLVVPYDPFLDMELYEEAILKHPKMGIFTIGGGVPRNWAQQIAPFLDIKLKRLGEGPPVKRFHYGVRICPEPVHWGGLSGCTYKEGISWGKFIPEAEGGQFAEVLSDATVALPLLIQSIIERKKFSK
jgi:deoxyhypusine synthase